MVSWIIIVVMTVLAIILTRNLKVTGEISKRQALLELAYEKAQDFFKGIMGEKVEKFIPWLMSVALFIGVSNIIGLFGLAADKEYAGNCLPCYYKYSACRIYGI